MIPYQTIVREKLGKRRVGIVCPAAPTLDDEDGVTVVFPPLTVAVTVNENLLEIVGPESAVADAEKCGAGHGKLACMYLIAAKDGLRCDRFSVDRWLLYFALRSRGLRNPTEAYPACQLPERGALARSR